jgi:hypothetical protein
MELYNGKGSTRRTLSSYQASLEKAWSVVLLLFLPLYPLVVLFSNYFDLFFYFIIANHMLSNLFCSSLGTSIHACQDSGCHLVAFKSNLFIFKAALALLCNPLHPSLLVESALKQTMVFNNDDSPPKHLAN